MTIRRARLPRTACLLAVALLAAAALLATATSALADSATLTITDSAGRPDPVADVPRAFTVSGTASPSQSLFVGYRPAGGAGCAPTPASDPGTAVFYNYPVNGPFSFTRAYTVDEPGAYQFCIWLTPSATTYTPNSISQVFTFRPPAGSIAASIDPPTPRPGQAAQVTVTGSSEAERGVFASVRPAGAPCAPAAGFDSGHSVIYGTAVSGAFTQQATIWLDLPGNYLLCLWLASSASDSRPIAGPQAVPFRVAAPAPPPPPTPKLRSARLWDCATHRRLATVRARSVRPVCMHYDFRVAPQAGQKLTVTFITPSRRTYKRASTKWPARSTKSIMFGSLLARGYKHRRGTWRAVLRVADKQVNSTRFRVR